MSEQNNSEGQVLRVIVADDHQIVIDGVKAILNDEEDIEVVGEALNGQALIELAERQPAEVALIDVSMPGMDGKEATKRLKKSHPHLKILVQTMHNDRRWVTEMLKAGVSGYILKNTGKKEMVQAIKTVAAGQNYYSQEVTATVMGGFNSTVDAQTAQPVELTPREKDVLRLIAQEFTTQEIAEKLFIAVNTVDTHRKNLHSKLNVKTAVGLVKYAIKMGLTED